MFSAQQNVAQRAHGESRLDLGAVSDVNRGNFLGTTAHAIEGYTVAARNAYGEAGKPFSMNFPCHTK